MLHYDGRRGHDDTGDRLYHHDSSENHVELLRRFHVNGNTYRGFYIRHLFCRREMLSAWQERNELHRKPKCLCLFHARASGRRQGTLQLSAWRHIPVSARFVLGIREFHARDTGRGHDRVYEMRMPRHPCQRRGFSVCRIRERNYDENFQ